MRLIRPGLRLGFAWASPGPRGLQVGFSWASGGLASGASGGPQLGFWNAGPVGFRCASGGWASPGLLRVGLGGFRWGSAGLGRVSLVGFRWTSGGQGLNSPELNSSETELIRKDSPETVKTTFSEQNSSD